MLLFIIKMISKNEFVNYFYYDLLLRININSYIKKHLNTNKKVSKL